MQNRFKTALTGKSPGKVTDTRLIGGWHMSGSPVVAEAMAHVGYDFVVLDMEHGAAPLHDLGHLLRAVDAAGCMPVVRLASHSATQIKQALDLGASTLYLPMVQNAQQAAQIAAACRYPPQGARGYAKMLRASQYTADADYFASANSQVMVIAQIETLDAIDNLEAIARTPGIDGLFVGPGDLAVSMGFAGDVVHPQVLAQLEKVGRWCAENHVPLGCVLPNAQWVEWAFSRGYQFVSMGSDLGLMLGAMRAGLAPLRQPPR